MRYVSRALTFAACLVAGCQSFPAELDQPASFTTVDDVQLSELSRLLSDLSGQQVSLTDKVFADSDRLVLERSQRGGSEAQRLATGRNMDSPRVYRLVQNKGRCLLLDDADNGRHPLRGFSCQPI